LDLSLSQRSNNHYFGGNSAENSHIQHNHPQHGLNQNGALQQVSAQFMAVPRGV
jgi:hypothetical protein